MTRDEVIKLLREADAETCYDAMEAVQRFVWPSPSDRTATLWWIIASARELKEPAFLMGPAMMMVPEGFDWLVRNDTGKPCRAIVWQPRKWADAITADHPIPAIALTIAAVEAMP